jgi:hypothetical protein
MQRFRQGLRKIVDSPFVQLATGLILLLSGCATAYHDFVEADNSLRLGVHHGVMVWALVQVLGSLPDLIDGFERSLEAMERRRQR